MILAFLALAAAAWQAEPGMIGVQYVGRVPDDGVLTVKDWRNDGGAYVSDELKAVSFYSTDDRIGISTETFRGREPDGVAMWTIANFFSVPADRVYMHVNMECGLGADFAGRTSDTAYIVAVIDGRTTPNEELITGAVAAAQVDLVSGAIVPISTADVYCLQMLGD